MIDSITNSDSCSFAKSLLGRCVDLSVSTDLCFYYDWMYCLLLSNLYVFDGALQFNKFCDCRPSDVDLCCLLQKILVLLVNWLISQNILFTYCGTCAQSAYNSHMITVSMWVWKCVPERFQKWGGQKSGAYNPAQSIGKFFRCPPLLGCAPM